MLRRFVVRSTPITLNRFVTVWLGLCVLALPMLGHWHAIEHGLSGYPVDAAHTQALASAEPPHDHDEDANHSCALFDALTACDALDYKALTTLHPDQHNTPWRNRAQLYLNGFPPVFFSSRAPPFSSGISSLAA